MARHFARIFLLATLIVAAVQVTAFAATTEPCEIVSDINFPIKSLYVVPMNQDGWGNDLIAGRVLKRGDSCLMHYDPQNTSYKVRIDLANGEESFTFYDIDFSGAWKMYIWQDGKEFVITKNAVG